MSAITGQRQSPQPRETVTPVVRNDDWWPDVDMVLLRESVRLPGNVTDKRLVFETKRALRAVNNELAQWKIKRKSEGCTTLAGVPLPAGEDNPELLAGYYQDAIFSHVDAKLCERYRNTDTTGAGDKRADMVDPRITEALRDKHLAVSGILGYDMPSHLTVTVELI